MLTFSRPSSFIEITDVRPNYTDHMADYHYNYLNQGVVPTSVQAVKLYIDNKLQSGAIIGANGGATGVHSNTALLNKDQLITCCSDSVFCLSATNLILNWKTKADWATCFAVHLVNQKYLIHGEMYISMLDEKGNILWQQSGADIFVNLNSHNNLVITENRIKVIDFQENEYKFDFEGNTIS